MKTVKKGSINVAAAFKAVVADIAKLQNKALAASVVATAVAVLAPLGLNLGPYGGKILGVLAAVSAIAAIAEKLFVKS